MWTVILLFAAGIVLVLAEFIVPGAILGVLGGICLLVSAGLGWYLFPEYALFIVIGEFIGSFLAVVAGLYIMSHTRAGDRLVMKKAQNKEEGFTSPAEDPALVGKVGEVFSALRPAGAILVDGRRVQAVSDGTFIDKGMQVRVIEVEGQRVVVEAAETSAQKAAT